MAGRKRKLPASSSPKSQPAPPGEAEAPAEEAGARAPSSPFAIVGVGASAGGLEAFTQMLGALPVDTGMAFVLVQHLAPTHASMLAEILSRTTAMPVAEVQDEPRVKPNRVYVIPPGRNMIISRGVLQLLPRKEAHGRHRPIDFFLRSLAEDQKDRAIGVILSGTATDGTLGLEQIKAEGGITFAQDDSAQQTSMPRSAVASGCVDFVLPPDGIAREIGRIARHPFVAPAAPARRQEPASEPDLGRILEIVRQVTDVDFSQYKTSTLHRRISRRMVLHKLDGLADYARLLRKNLGEVEALYQDILINVTSFFRNPETFEALAKVLPELLADRSRHGPLRVWVPGCSSGEEAYSIAILIAELAEARDKPVPAQVFATDLNAAGIDKARAGVYAKNVEHDVSPQRLQRWFAEVDGGYRVNKAIRDMCVFARHNLLTDPPFSQIDLISCRNLLIYLEPVLQQRIVPLLHYALKPSGFLLLGSSETIGSYRELFEAEDVKHRIYVKKPGTHRVIPGPAAGPHQARAAAGHGPAHPPQAAGGTDVQKEADRILLTRYAPPGVLVDSGLEILKFRGDIGPFLTPAPGKASLNLLRMAREGLAVALRAAIGKARKAKAPVREEGLRVQANGGTREVDLEVVPVKGSSAGAEAFLVLFAAPAPSPQPPAPRGSKGRKPDAQAAAREESERENARLKQELAHTREYLQSVIEQQEAVNEELQSANEEAQSANEEAQSANEELQSINEELETSKEEIQSSNEELVTVNDELQDRNRELNRLNDELGDLLDGVRRAREYAESIVATVRESLLILDGDLRVKTASRSFYQTFRLTPAETEGHLLYDLGNGPWNDPELHRLLDEVLPRDDGFDDFEMKHELEHSGRKTLALSARRLVQESGHSPLILLAIEDVTLRQRVEDLAAADRRKNEFLALLAHELRNPLAPLRNAVYVLENPDAGPAAVKRVRDMMGRQVENMARMIDDLLDVSRVTQGKIRLRKQRVELAALLTGAVELAREHIEARGQEVALSLPREPVELDADPTRLEQVFGNLLSNASKFTPKGGHLWMTAEMANGDGPEPPGEVVVRVRDDGIGMAPETLLRVFDLFMQADGSLDRARGGLGIGLTLVHRLVALHGGSVEARSAGLGEGSELVVRLPVLPPAAKELKKDGEAGSSTGAGSSAASPRRILVVDDNVDAAESLALLLRLRGHEVEVVYDGPAALETAGAFHPEVVLLDIGLPGLDGYQVAGRLRRRRRTAGALLVALTGYGQEEDQQRAREAGFDHHLTKPVDLPVLYELLAHPPHGRR